VAQKCSLRLTVMTDHLSTQISTGAHRTCGIKPKGRALCWGLGWGGYGRAHQIAAIM